ncbi:MAG: CvpA family protein [Gallionella sp.]|nr:CvpA family protein [Gallionella sp.]
MTLFDFAVIGIILASLVLGLFRGLVYEVLSFLGWPVAYFSSKFFAGAIAPMMPITQESMRIAVAYVVVFIVGLIAWSILVFLLTKIIKAIGLGGIDTFLGGLFGVLRGAMIVVALASLAGLTDIPKQPFWQQSSMSKTVESFAILAKTYLPESVAQRVQFPSRS